MGILMFFMGWGLILLLFWLAVKFTEWQERDQTRREKAQLEREYLIKKIDQLSGKNDDED